MRGCGIGIGSRGRRFAFYQAQFAVCGVRFGLYQARFAFCGRRFARYRDRVRLYQAGDAFCQGRIRLYQAGFRLCRVGIRLDQRWSCFEDELTARLSQSGWRGGDAAARSGIGAKFSRPRGNISFPRRADCTVAARYVSRPAIHFPAQSPMDLRPDAD